jgi:hypothetical protein
MSDQPAHEILAKLFQTIVKEAETNEKFANEMLAVLSDSLSEISDESTNEAKPKIEQASEKNKNSQKKTKTLPKAEPLDARIRARTKPKQREENKAEKETLNSESENAKEIFDLKSHNPIILYRNMGEDLMRVKLNKVSATNLKKIGKHYQLRLTSLTKTKSPTKPDIINAIITFAKNYDAQRKGAAG